MALRQNGHRSSSVVAMALQRASARSLPSFRAFATWAIAWIAPGRLAAGALGGGWARRAAADRWEPCWFVAAFVGRAALPLEEPLWVERDEERGGA